jgi:hypothetical protein
MSPETKTKVFNAEKVEVTSFLENGRTFFALTKKEAEKKANQIRSYFYELFDDKQNHVGYGIPK